MCIVTVLQNALEASEPTILLSYFVSLIVTPIRMNPMLIFHYLILLHQCHIFYCFSDIFLYDKHWCNFSCCDPILFFSCSLKLWILGILSGYWCLGLILSHCFTSLAFCLSAVLCLNVPDSNTSLFTMLYYNQQIPDSGMMHFTLLCTCNSKGALRSSLVWTINVPWYCQIIQELSFASEGTNRRSRLSDVLLIQKNS